MHRRLRAVRDGELRDWLLRLLRRLLSGRDRNHVQRAAVLSKAMSCVVDVVREWRLRKLFLRKLLVVSSGLRSLRQVGRRHVRPHRSLQQMSAGLRCLCRVWRSQQVTRRAKSFESVGML
jgi:hypothetical protein